VFPFSQFRQFDSFIRYWWKADCNFFRKNSARLRERKILLGNLHNNVCLEIE
jgi:hypothetical protein